VVVGWARGGRLEALARASLRGMPLLGAALAMVVLARVPGQAPAVARILQGLGYLAALAVLWQNRSHPWALVILVGLGLNALVLMLNMGRMPVSDRALAGVTHSIDPQAASADLDARHFIVGPGTRLPQLGDVVAVGAWGVGVVLSPGDVVLAIGLAGFVQSEMCAWRPASAGG
jgi:hypothetical protein